MKYLIILLLLFLSACSTTALVDREFPKIPKSLEKSCQELSLVPNDTQRLSQVLQIVTANYGKYHECSLQVELWKEWYSTQKAIFDEVK